MNILVFYKKSNYDKHSVDVRDLVLAGKLSEHYLEVLKRSHEEHYSCLEKVKNYFYQHEIQYKFSSREEAIDLKNYQLVITVGGDGTLLSAAKRLKRGEIPVLGIRSSQDSVGYLCGANLHNVEERLDQILAQKISPLHALRFRARIESLATGHVVYSEPIFNDLLYSHVAPAATTRYLLKYHQQEELQKSSGVWICSPFGSTAAAKAAGGDPMEQDKQDQIQFVVREAYGEVKLSKGLIPVNKMTESFSIENHCDHALCSIDGSQSQIILHIGDQLKFERSPDLLLYY